jgi:hypothetical protein
MRGTKGLSSYDGKVYITPMRTGDVGMIRWLVLYYTVSADICISGVTHTYLSLTDWKVNSIIRHNKDKDAIGSAHQTHGKMTYVRT